MMRALLLSVALLGLAACDSADSTTPPADAQSGEVELALGASASLDGFDLSFQEVVQDSRCPIDVDCVWAGIAVVKVRVDGETHTLTVADPERSQDAALRLGDHLLFAARLTPEPTADERTPTNPVLTVVTVEVD